MKYSDIKRCKMKLGYMKTKFIVDTDTLSILVVHATVIRKHDSKIILPLVNKTLKQFRIKYPQSKSVGMSWV